MQDIRELRDSLADNYEAMKQGNMDVKTGKQLANTAGKILGSLKVEMEYYTANRIANPIPFLEPKKKRILRK